MNTDGKLLGRRQTARTRLKRRSLWSRLGYAYLASLPPAITHGACWLGYLPLQGENFQEAAFFGRGGGYGVFG
jgi:hypothetical protein